MRPGRSGGSQRQASVFCQSDDLFRGPRRGVQADEIAAIRSRPGRCPGSGQPAVQRRVHSGELRRQQRAMAVHVAHQPGLIFQETHMAKLIQLIRADRAFEGTRQIPGDVGGGRREECQSRTGKGYLRCRSEHESPVRMSGFRAGVQDVGDFVPVFGQVMNRVGVVPEQTEIRRPCAHRGQPADRFGGIHLPARVGVFWHAPHPFHRRIGGQRFDRVHVGPVPGQRNREHADAVFLAQRKMAVVTRHRTDEGRFGPGFGRSRNALQQRPHDAVVHHREAGIVGNHDLIRGRSQHWGEQGSDFRKALQDAVVAGVLTRLGHKVAVAGEGEHRVRQIELLRRRLAARHVEFQATRPERVIVGPHRLAQGMKAGIRQIDDTVHRPLGLVAGGLSRNGAGGNHIQTRCGHAPGGTRTIDCPCPPFRPLLASRLLWRRQQS